MMIEMVGYNGKPLWIESRRVVAISPSPPAMCIVVVACGECTEKWTVGETADTVRRAVDEANEKGYGARGYGARCTGSPGGVPPT